MLVVSGNARSTTLVNALLRYLYKWVRHLVLCRHCIVYCRRSLVNGHAPVGHKVKHQDELRGITAKLIHIEKLEVSRFFYLSSFIFGQWTGTGTPGQFWPGSGTIFDRCTEKYHNTHACRRRCVSSIFFYTRCPWVLGKRN